VLGSTIHGISGIYVSVSVNANTFLFPMMLNERFQRDLTTHHIPHHRIYISELEAISCILISTSL